MQLNNLFLPYDVYSRHQIVANLIHRSGAVLDVGGSLKELAQFLPAKIKLFSTDVVGGDIIYDGHTLPFRNKSVETVVSIDTIEHIPASVRQPFIQELIRVAKKKVIIAAPMGTAAHIKTEKSEPFPDQYLIEHIRFGLPSVEEIKQWVKPFTSHNLIFQGNFHFAKTLYHLQQSQIRLPKLGRLWYETKKIIFAMINICLFPWDKNLPFSQNTNRFYLQINL